MMHCIYFDTTRHGNHFATHKLLVCEIAIREQCTNLYRDRDTGEFDVRCRIDLEIWNQWLPLLHHRTTDDTV